MQIKSIYKVRNIAGENLIIEQGKLHSDMTKVISLNPTALLLWNELHEKEFTLQDAAAVLTSHFGIPQERAESDAQRWIDSLSSCGIIE